MEGEKVQEMKVWLVSRKNSLSWTEVVVFVATTLKSAVAFTKLKPLTENDANDCIAYEIRCWVTDVSMRYKK